MAPTDAAATPLPSEETTPPVTKMYLVAMRPPSSSVRCPFVGLNATRSQDTFHPLQVLRGVDAERPRVDDEHADRDAVLQRPQLLERLAALERRGRQPGEAQQGLALVAVDAQVLERRGAALLPRVGDRRAAEVEGVAGAVEHHLDRVRVLQLLRLAVGVARVTIGIVRVRRQVRGDPRRSPPDRSAARPPGC